jgi:hypothetical protein
MKTVLPSFSWNFSSVAPVMLPVAPPVPLAVPSVPLQQAGANSIALASSIPFSLSHHYHQYFSINSNSNSITPSKQQQYKVTKSTDGVTWQPVTAFSNLD